MLSFNTDPLKVGTRTQELEKQRQVDESLQAVIVATHCKVKFAKHRKTPEVAQHTFHCGHSNITLCEHVSCQIQRLMQQHMLETDNRLDVSSHGVGKQTARILAVEETWKKQWGKKAAQVKRLLPECRVKLLLLLLLFVDIKKFSLLKPKRKKRSMNLQLAIYFFLAAQKKNSWK